MKKSIATWLRRLANWLDQDPLAPLARKVVDEVAKQPRRDIARRMSSMILLMTAQRKMEVLAPNALTRDIRLAIEQALHERK